MELLKKRYRTTMILSIILFILTTVLSIGFSSLARMNKSEYLKFPKFTLARFCLILIAYLYILILLTVYKYKSVKVLSSLNSEESEYLFTSMDRNEMICECCFLENRLVWTKGIQWHVLAYDNIKSIRKDYTILKRWGKKVGKVYTIHFTMKTGKPKVVSVAINMIQYKDEYPKLCQKLEEIDPMINTLSFVSKLR